jgi:hypothetical protein
MHGGAASERPGSAMPALIIDRCAVPVVASVSRRVLDLRLDRLWVQRG